MISFLSGKVIQLDGNQAVIELPGAGIGLNVTVSANALTQLEVGNSCHVHTELLVREDAWLLYGFQTVEERSWFRLLNAISGIGPKTALATISVLGIAGLRNAIASGDEGALTAVPGLGKKSAGRIMLELSDKIKIIGQEVSNSDVVNALINLGWSEKVARQTLNEISEPNLDTASLLRAALAKLAKS
ncbi:MAG: hypothetical protein RIT32_971 [Actinomycetota bacterium]|jgi:Holliday junction DNA helicase RuvA